MNGIPLAHQRAAAFGIAAAVMLVPANLLPVITLSTIERTRTDTIFSSVVGLFESGLWHLAVIVFAASFAVPLFKLWGLGCLIYASRRGKHRHSRRLTRLYTVLDRIGPWSMLDVFLVAFLAGVVRFGTMATIVPRSGAFAFGAAVVLTMLATHAFDPRRLWEPAQGTGDEGRETRGS